MRVLACFKLNPYEILDLNWMPGAGVTDQDIREYHTRFVCPRTPCAEAVLCR